MALICYNSTDRLSNGKYPSIADNEADGFRSRENCHGDQWRTAPQTFFSYWRTIAMYRESGFVLNDEILALAISRGDAKRR